MPITLPQIQAAWYSPRIGVHGEVVTDFEDINQAIAIILTTPKGTDPHRPEFASSLDAWIDHPTNTVSPHLIREIYEAILRWEPRVDIVSVEVETPYLAEIQRVMARVVWALKDSELQGGVEVLI